MSGHSKWATIKRKKAVTDAARGKAFTKHIKEITIAARAGGGDPEANPRLRSAILAAKSVNMPAHNIERAIKRGSGDVDGVAYEETQYEGYGPGGVAVLVEVATDNRNRTTGDVRNIFSKNGGNLGEAGSVSYLFRPRGVITVERSAAAEDALIELALDAGADDVATSTEGYEVLTSQQSFEAVKDALARAGIATVAAELTKLASQLVPVNERGAASIVRLMEALEDHDDVQKVYANFDVSDEILAKLDR